MLNKQDKLCFKDYLFNILAMFIALGIIVAMGCIKGIAIKEPLDVNYNLRIACLAGFVGIMFIGMFGYLYYINKNLLKDFKIMTLILVIILSTTAINLLLGDSISVFIRPIALAGLLVFALVGKGVGIFAHLFSCIIMLALDIVFIPSNANIEVYKILFTNFMPALALSIGVGTYFLFTANKAKRRIGIIMVGIKVSVIAAIACVGLGLFVNDFENVLKNSIWSLASSLITVVLYSSLLPIFEYTFNVITDYRLIEFTDHNNKLLKELAQKAPGTFNHSIVVGNLAEVCAMAIGANTNLARACAYYHDIGKIVNANYFKENQGGMNNPHDDITPEVSVGIIKNHTKNGVEIAQKYKLPKQIIEVIEQHHGTLPIKVFYFKALKYTDGELSLDGFCYDGPKPQSKIAVIIMLVDACEAVARTITDKSYENVEKLVASIIDERIHLNQFIDCDITFKELEIIKTTIVNTLCGVYHERIKYPNITFTDKGVVETSKND